MLIFRKELTLNCTDCFGLMDKMAFCKKCTLPFHPHCIESICNSCQSPKKIVIKNNNLFDIYENKIEKFTKRPNKNFITKSEVTRCFSCKKDGAFFYEKFWCINCFSKVKKNQFCSVCMKTYKSDDYNTPMINCDYCLKWIHLKCTNISHKEYKKLSNINSQDKIEFCCYSCELNIKKFTRVTHEPQKKICSLCQLGYFNENPAFVLFPIFNEYFHLNCKSMTSKCVVCKASDPATVKCRKCKDAFHTLCSSGLFRQNANIAMCNAHFKVGNYKEMIYRMFKKQYKKICLNENESFYFKGVIYKSNEFIRLYFGKNFGNKNYECNIQLKTIIDLCIDTLSFDGNIFCLNGVNKSLEELQLLGINAYEEDIFKISQKEFLIFSHCINQDILKKLCIITKNPNYCF